MHCESKLRWRGGVCVLSAGACAIMALQGCASTSRVESPQTESLAVVAAALPAASKLSVDQDELIVPITGHNLREEELLALTSFFDGVPEFEFNHDGRIISFAVYSDNENAGRSGELRALSITLDRHGHVVSCVLPEAGAVADCCLTTITFYPHSTGVKCSGSCTTVGQVCNPQTSYDGDGNQVVTCGCVATP